MILPPTAAAQELRMVGERIRSARKALGLTQRDVAGNDFTRGFISQIENGLIVPSLVSLVIIAERLRKPVAWFLEADNESSTRCQAEPIDNETDRAGKLSLKPVPNDIEEVFAMIENLRRELYHTLDKANGNLQDETFMSIYRTMNQAVAHYTRLDILRKGRSNKKKA